MTRPAFKIDENLPREVAGLLKEHGYDALTVHEQSLVGRPDADIASVCRSEDRALITLDRDFSNIRAYPPAQHPGIVVLRSEHHDKPTVLGLISSVLLMLAKEPLARNLWIVESDRVRIWRSWDE